VLDLSGFACSIAKAGREIAEREIAEDESLREISE
jgi:hypothetical protein